MRIILEEANLSRLSKLKTIFFGKKKIKFFITPISPFSKMRKIKILSMNTPFSWNRSRTSWADNGKSKQINCSNPMLLADKYL